VNCVSRGPVDFFLGGAFLLLFLLPISEILYMY